MAKRKTEQETAAQDAEVQYVTLKLPIRELEPSGYGCSLEHLPRQLRSRQLSRRQGIALASLRLGMIAEAETLDDRKTHFLYGTREQATVNSKEEVIARLLEHIAHAIDERGQS